MKGASRFAVTFTYDSGQDGVVGIHSLERLFYTDTILDEDNCSVLTNHRFQLFRRSWAGLNSLVCGNNILEVDTLQAGVGGSSDGCHRIMQHKQLLKAGMGQAKGLTIVKLVVGMVAELLGLKVETLL